MWLIGARLPALGKERNQSQDVKETTAAIVKAAPQNDMLRTNPTLRNDIITSEIDPAGTSSRRLSIHGIRL